MNKSLRLKIEESISSNQISEVLCLLCLAALHEKITYSKQSIAGHGYEEQRNIIAKAAVQHGVSTDTISTMIQKVSPQDYPTFKTIERVAEIIKKGHYSFYRDFIPIKWIHYKSDEEIQKDLSRTPTQRIKDLEAECIREIISYIRTKFELYENLLSNDVILKRIQKIKTKEHTYEIILQTLKWFDGDILKSTRNIRFDEPYDKLSYIVNALKNCIPRTEEKIHQQQWQREQAERISREYFNYTSPAPYVRKTSKLSEHQRKLFDELW